jgi:acetate CoA/acetoacetate CoA-transferase alpha subunit
LRLEAILESLSAFHPTALNNISPKLERGVYMAKVISVEEAVNMIKDGARLMIGGFAAVGSPESIIKVMVRKGVKNLTVIANDSGVAPDKGMAKLVNGHQVKKFIVSHIGTNPETGRQYREKETEVELVPQGTLVERIRAGGAGLGGVLTATGLGTVVAEGKQTVSVDGKEYLLEKPLRAEFALINAYKADEKGNLIFNGTARNYNPLIATAADTVIAEVEEIVPSGELDPEAIVVPGVLVNYLVKKDGEA